MYIILLLIKNLLEDINYLLYAFEDKLDKPPKWLLFN